MNTLRWLLVFSAGALTYFLAVVVGGNLLAAIPMPAGLYGAFGLGTGALGLWTAFTCAVPVALLVWLGAFFTLRKPNRSRSKLFAFGLGMIFMWVLSHYPDMFLMTPFWAISILIAPWIGLLLAIQYVRKAEQRQIALAAN